MELVFAIIIIVIIAIIFLLNKKKKDNQKTQQKEGIAYIKQIKALITNIQQHRGLTAAWLNGDNSVHAQLLTLKKKISNDMSSIALTPVNVNERYVAFSDHWQRLIKLNNSLTVANSFEQHTMMIQNLAYLLEDTAENHHLTATYVNDIANIGYVWRELVLAIESLGQSRAIGTGVTTLQFCSSVDKIRLEFLIQRMTKLSDQTLPNLSYLCEEKNTHIKLINTATDHTKKLINMMSSELVNKEKVTIGNDEYFSLATLAMSKMNDIFDHQMIQINKVV